MCAVFSSGECEDGPMMRAAHIQALWTRNELMGNRQDYSNEEFVADTGHAWALSEQLAREHGPVHVICRRHRVELSQWQVMPEKLARLQTMMRRRREAAVWRERARAVRGDGHYSIVKHAGELIGEGRFSEADEYLTLRLAGDRAWVGVTTDRELVRLQVEARRACGDAEGAAEAGWVLLRLCDTEPYADARGYWEAAKGLSEALASMGDYETASFVKHE